MNKLSSIGKIFLSIILFSVCFNLSAGSKEKQFEIILRTGQGGYYDSRSEIDKLGGGQMAIDIKPINFPLAFSYSGEYYTNSPAPTHPYEISEMNVFNLLYMKRPFETDRINLFGGGGLGWLKVPKDNSEEKTYTGMAFNLEAGISVRVVWKFGFYSIYKFIYAYRAVDSIAVIDFSEHAVLIGLQLGIKI